MGRGGKNKNNSSKQGAPKVRSSALHSAVVDNVSTASVENVYTQKELQEARDLLREMEEIAGPLQVDPTLVAAIPSRDPKEALLWLYGDRSLIQDPEEVAPQMTAAAKDLLLSLQSGEKVALFCDYDVDGVTGGEILRNVFVECGQEPHMGYASASYGFGLTRDFVQEAYEQGCQTIVTVDCGSSSLEAIDLAKELGLKVIITDHHDILDPEANKADYHLNPGLQDPPSSEATGSQMAWHLGAAILREKEGEIPEEHYKENLFLAGLGCVADWGTHLAPENRPFLKAADPPEGIRLLAYGNYENADSLEKLWKTSALLNLAKRTPEVSGADAARAIRAKTKEESEAAKAVLEEAKKRDGKKKSALQKEAASSKPRAASVFHVTEMEGVSGSTGVVAPSLSSKHNVPAFVFAPMKEIDGEKIYKFSGRQPNASYDIADLGKDPELQEIILSGGGHSRVFSGECREKDIEKVQSVIDRWAQKQTDESFGKELNLSSQKKEKVDQKKVVAHERLVDPERILSLHSGSRQMAPYHSKRDGYNPPTLSVRGILSDVTKEGYKTVATLNMTDGSEMKVQIGSYWDADQRKFQTYDVSQEADCEVFVSFKPGEKLLAVEHTEAVSDT